MENEIARVLIIVELKNGNAHQLLATRENKKLAVDLLGQMEGAIRLDKKLVPFELQKED